MSRSDPCGMMYHGVCDMDELPTIHHCILYSTSKFGAEGIVYSSAYQTGSSRTTSPYQEGGRVVVMIKEYGNA